MSTTPSTAATPVPDAGAGRGPGHAERVAWAAAEALGVRPDAVQLLASSTSSVYRLGGTGLVVRLAGRDHARPLLATQLRHARLLVDAGVGFAAPACEEPMAVPGGVWATVWHDLGEAGPVRFGEWGQLLAALHSAGTDAFRAHPEEWSALEDAEQTAGLLTRLDDLVAGGAATGDEVGPLSEWVAWSADRLAERGPAPRVLLHDDVWPKNVVCTPARVAMVDPDNLRLGVADADLGFLTRAVETGAISACDGREFAAGYGRPLPDLGTAWLHGRLHEVRWLLDLFARRTWSPHAATMLAEGLQLFRPGPR